LNLLGNRFALERQIGAGGMARVFLGRDMVLNRPVAIKILNPGYGGTDIGARFRREGRTAARLSHPNIVQVYDAGEGELEGREVSYIVMEYVPGGDLKGLIDEKGPMPNDELARLGAEVSSGLAHAHERGVIHRDIKPHNVLIDAHGRPKLTDFGIARALDTTQATQTGSYLGTALYSSPEQLRGEKVTPKSDVYSLGIALYQAAVGKAPFSGTPIEIASQHVTREPDTPSVLGANLSDELETLILDCVNKDPDRRPTAQEVHERLREEAHPAPTTLAYAAAPPISEPSPAERTGTRTRTAPPEDPPVGPPPDAPQGEASRRRGPIFLGVAALLLVALAAAGAYAMLGGESPETSLAPPEENQQASLLEDTELQGILAGGSEDTVSGQAASEDTTAGSSGGGSSEEAAAQAVEDYYDAAANGDYEEAWNYLSSGYQQQQGSQEAYTAQFSTLQSIEWAEGPTARVSGDTATVTGETTAKHTDRTERNRGTWTLVNEGGEWKISDQNVSNISTDYA
jgi:eukaryotic-like serine/threonine-protein kinase